MDNIKKARITRKEAAVLAKVSERTINRWSAEALLDVEYGGWREPATYDPDQVLRAVEFVKQRNADLAALRVPGWKKGPEELANPESGGTVVS